MSQTQARYRRVVLIANWLKNWPDSFVRPNHSFIMNSLANPELMRWGSFDDDSDGNDGRYLNIMLCVIVMKFVLIFVLNAIEF